MAEFFPWKAIKDKKDKGKEAKTMERKYTVKHESRQLRLTIGSLSAEYGGAVAVSSRTPGFYMVRRLELTRSEAFALSAILAHLGYKPRVIRIRNVDNMAAYLSQSESAELFARAARIESMGRTDAP